MASLRQSPRSGRYLVVFRYGGRQYQRSLKTTDPKSAASACARVEDTLRLIEQGRLEIPADVDPADFILADGRLTKPRPTAAPLTIKQLFATYRETLPEAAKEKLTIAGEDIHIAHLKRHFGSHRVVQTIGLTDVQGYVTARAQERYRGRPITADTIRKELSTFRLIWNWARAEGRLALACPTRGVKFPKRDAKPPFMTWDEIERTIARGGLDGTEAKRLWDCLFLTTEQIAELLNDVRTHARRPVVYPLFLFCAHTGARRSELLRSRIDDFDFDLRMVHIREKKRSRKQSTTYRRVPMSETLAQGMQAWFAEHPGGQYTISEGDGPLELYTATNYFRQALAHTKWHGKLKGFHVLRHSFASNAAAAAGVDPGMIDAWMGHQTEEMRERYRHLFPRQQQTAIDRIFAPPSASRSSNERSVRDAV